MTLPTLHPFAIFVRDLPRRTDIQQRLNIFQKERGLNLNVLLYCVWYAETEQGRLRKPDFKRLKTVLHPWHERICLELQHLSAALRNVSTFQYWVDIEYNIANQLEQQMLAETLASNKKLVRNPNQQLTDACYNLVTYFKSMHMHFDDQAREILLTILPILFEDSDPLQIQQSLEQALNAARYDESGFTQLQLV